MKAKKLDDKKVKGKNNEEEKKVKEEAEKGEAKSGGSMFIIIAAVIVMIIVIIGPALMLHRQRTQKYETYTYNGLTFVKSGLHWVTQIESGNKLYTVPLRYGPRELEDIHIYGLQKLSPEFINANYVYITFDPEVESEITNSSYLILAATELRLNLEQGIQRTAIAACTKNVTEGCKTWAIVRCEESALVCKGVAKGNLSISCKPTEPVIYLDPRPTESGNAEIDLKPNCIHLKGEDEDILRAVDRLMLWWYGIMKP